MYRDSEIGVVFHHGVLSRSTFPVRVAQLLSILFAVVYAALGARFLLRYVQAPSSPFVLWVDRLTDRVYVPLRALVPDGSDRAGHPLAWSLLLAIAACALAQWCVIAFLRDVSRPRLDLEE
jgi:uncharacterized protein YggT (Ycf19 family)